MEDLDLSMPFLLPLLRAKVPVWLVGGAVRDHLASGPPRDLDLVVGAELGRIRTLLPEAVSVGKTSPALILSRGPGRSPLQILPLETSLDLELKRRDFTVNAMALPISFAGLSGALVDPFGGREDLSKRLLRRPDRSRDPFREDPLRILRLLRFVSTLGLSVEGETLALARKAASTLVATAGERRLAELRLFWEGAFLKKAGEILSPDLCGEILWGAIVGKNVEAMGEGSGSGAAFVRAAALAGYGGIVRIFVFVEECRRGSVQGEENEVGPNPWREGKDGSDLPFSRRERQALSALSRLSAFYRRWPEAFPPERRDRSLLLRDPTDGAFARWSLRRNLSGPEGERFRSWCESMREMAERPWRDRPRGLEGTMNPRSRRR